MMSSRMATMTKLDEVACVTVYVLAMMRMRHSAQNENIFDSRKIGATQSIRKSAKFM